MTRAHDGLHFFGGPREHDEPRTLTQTREAVGLERQELAGIAEEAVGADRARDLGDERGYHATIESSKSRASSSGPAARGDSFVTRCCGSVPSTSAGMSDEP